MERVLEVLVQRVEQAVTEAPEEEEDGDEREGKDGLSQRELSSSCAALVVGLERPLPEEGRNTHDGKSRSEGPYQEGERKRGEERS